MNEIKIRYTLDDGNVIEKYIRDTHKLHYIDLNLLVFFEAPLILILLKVYQLK